MKTQTIVQPTQEGQNQKSMFWPVMKVIIVFSLVLLSIYAVKAFVSDIVLEKQEAAFTEAVLMEQKARAAMEAAIAGHEQSEVTLCKAYTALRAYKQLKNLPIINPDYNPCLHLMQKVENKVEQQQPQTPSPPLIQIPVDVTTYNPEKGQTDNSPCIGASGKDQCKLAKEGVKIIAVSRDLRKFFPYGSQVFVESNDPAIQGCYFVEDTMNERFKNRIDIFLLDKSQNTKGKGVLSNKIENCKL